MRSTRDESSIQASFGMRTGGHAFAKPTGVNVGSTARKVGMSLRSSIIDSAEYRKGLINYLPTTLRLFAFHPGFPRSCGGSDVFSACLSRRLVEDLNHISQAVDCLTEHRSYAPQGPPAD